MYSFVDAYRKVSFVMFRKMLIEVNGDDKLEHRVSKEFHALVTTAEVKKKAIVMTHIMRIVEENREMNSP